MVERYILIYLFVCFALGVACLGVTLVLVQRRGDLLARSFLAFYAALSVTVTSALLLAFVSTVPDSVAPSTRFWLEYTESLIGRYSVMFTLPFFAHRVFAIRDFRRDRWLLAITVAAFAAQHVTEYVFGGSIWDDRGDTAEDIVFAAVVLYTAWIGLTRFRAAGVSRPLAWRFNLGLAIGLPGIAYDIFLSDGSLLRFYPFWYCVLSIGFTLALVRRQKASEEVAIPAEWGLSEREREVVLLVQQGLSNKELAGRMGISINTVKTHLRAIFEKSRARSRFDLMSHLIQSPGDRGQAGDKNPD